MLNFLSHHRTIDLLFAYWLISAAVSSMPEPAQNGNPFYFWFYRFIHTFVGNITTAFGDRIKALTGNTNITTDTTQK